MMTICFVAAQHTQEINATFLKYAMLLNVVLVSYWMSYLFLRVIAVWA